MAQLVGIRAYARHRGLSQPAVQHAIKRGTLAGALVQQPGKTPLIDVELADQLWAARTDPAKKGLGTPAPAKPGTQAGLFGAGGSPPPAGSSDPAVTYHHLRAAGESIKVRRAQLDLQAREGELIDAKAATEEWFRRVRLTRDAILAVPARVRDTLAATADPAAVAETLTRELEIALAELSREPG